MPFQTLLEVLGVSNALEVSNKNRYALKLSKYARNIVSHKYLHYLNVRVEGPITVMMMMMMFIIDFDKFRFEAIFLNP